LFQPFYFVVGLLCFIIYIVVSFLILISLKYWVSNLQLSIIINKKVM